MDILNLREERAALVAKMRGILDTAESEGRDLTTEETAKFGRIEADVDAMKKRIDRAERVLEEEGALFSAVEEPLRPAVADLTPARAFASAEYAQAFEASLRRGQRGIQPQTYNALQVGTDSEGGYITAEEFDRRIVEAEQEYNDWAPYVDSFETSGDRNIPIEATLGVATWTGEEAAYTESDAAFGQVVIGAFKLATIIKVSEELVRDAVFDLPGYLARNFGKRFGIAKENAFVVGNGTGKPTGMVAGAQTGVTAAGATAITADETLDLFYSLKKAYRRRAIWTAATNTIKALRKLKDGNGQYIWQPGMKAGEPDVLHGRPFLESTDMPAMTTGQKSLMLGDPGYYSVARRGGRFVQRLDELYAANGQIGFRAYERLDGKTTLPEAFKVLVQG